MRQKSKVVPRHRHAVRSNRLLMKLSLFHCNWSLFAKFMVPTVTGSLELDFSAVINFISSHLVHGAKLTAKR